MIASVKMKLPVSRVAVSSLLFLVAGSLAMAMPSSYLVHQAGPVLEVTGDVDGKPVVTLSDVETHPSETDFYLTTVSSYGNPDAGVPVGKVLGALLFKDEQILPVRSMYPAELSADEVAEQNTQYMDFSQDMAAAVAFEQAGMDVSMALTVVWVDPALPSGKKLREGDVITGVAAPPTGGKIQPVTTFAELSHVLDQTDPGTEVTVGIKRAGKATTESFRTIPYEPNLLGDVHAGSLLGVALEVTDVKLPGKVEYVVEGIGGPSAGNMFALGIYDLLTPGSLGGKAVIAGTGTVAWDGDVGPISGIEHKLQGAAAVGATDFFAPVENCPETIGYEPEGMNIWAVSTTAETIAAVQALESGDTAKLRSCTDVADKAKSAGTVEAAAR